MYTHIYPQHQKKQVADAAALAKLHNEQACTLQVIQPQRWEDKSWRLVAALEAQVGCLVGGWAPWLVGSCRLVR